MKFIYTVFSTILILLQTNAQQTLEFHAAENAFQKEDYSKAVKLYTVVIETQKLDDYSYIFYKRGFSYYYLNNYKASKSDFDKAIKIAPYSKNCNQIAGNTYWMYGRLYSSKGKYAKAIKMLIKATLYTNESVLYSTIGYEQNNCKKYKAALQNLNQAIDLDHNNAYAYSNRALSYLKLNDLDKSRTDVNKSKLLDNKNPYVYKHSALIYIELKQYGLACSELQKAKELGYASFGNEADKNDVDKLLKKYCK